MICTFLLVSSLLLMLLWDCLTCWCAAAEFKVLSIQGTFQVKVPSLLLVNQISTYQIVMKLRIFTLQNIEMFIKGKLFSTTQCFKCEDLHLKLQRQFHGPTSPSRNLLCVSNYDTNGESQWCNRSSTGTSRFPRYQKIHNTRLRNMRSGPEKTKKSQKSRGVKMPKKKRTKPTVSRKTATKKNTRQRPTMMREKKNRHTEQKVNSKKGEHQT